MVPRKKETVTTYYDRWRMLSLTAAFLVILCNPFLIYYAGIDWIQGWYQSLGIGKALVCLLSKPCTCPALIGMSIPLVLALEGVIVVIILVLELLTRRFYCRYF